MPAVRNGDGYGKGEAKTREILRCALDDVLRETTKTKQILRCAQDDGVKNDEEKRPAGCRRYEMVLRNALRNALGSGGD